jgi:hypothetical protein
MVRMGLQTGSSAAGDGLRGDGLNSSSLSSSVCKLSSCVGDGLGYLSARVGKLRLAGLNRGVGDRGGGLESQLCEFDHERTKIHTWNACVGNRSGRIDWSSDICHWSGDLRGDYSD